jgi:HlyD family secretion protein
MMRWLLRHKTLIVVILAVLGIVAVAMWPETVEVDVARVVRGDIRVTLDEDGETRVRDRFTVSAPVSGRLQRIQLEPGDPVKRGAVVARLAPGPSPLLDPRTRSELAAAVEAARAAVGQAEAERDRAAAALARAKSTVARQDALAKAGAISRDELEAAGTALRTAEEASRAAEFTVQRARYELDLARARLQAPAAAGGPTVEIRAPVDGVVLRRLRESEAVVPPGEPLLEIGDPDRIEVVADFLSTDAVRIRPGAPVVIEQWGGGHPLHGRVRRIEPSGFMKVSALGVEEQRVYVVIDFADAPEALERLGDAYRVEVRAVVSEGTNVVKAPIGALFRRGEAWAVFRVVEGIATLTMVEVGQRNESEAEIVKGLSEGDAVIMHPPDTIADGMKVMERAQ